MGLQDSGSSNFDSGSSAQPLLYLRGDGTALSILSLTKTTIEAVCRTPDLHLGPGTYFASARIVMPSGDFAENNLIVERVHPSDHFSIVTFGCTQPNVFRYERPDEKPQNVVAFKPSRKSTEARTSQRVDIRYGDGVSVQIERDGPPLHASVYDLSTFGFSAVAEGVFDDDLPARTLSHLQIVDKNYVTNAHLAWVRKSGTQLRFGYRFHREPLEIRPDKPLISLPESLQICGVFYRENFFYENAQFRVLAIRKDELILRILDTELYLLPSMRLDLRFFLQTTGKASQAVTVTVVEIQAADRQGLVIRASLAEMSKTLENDLCSYLLHFLSVTPEQIRQTGLKLRGISDSFQFRHVRTHEEYLEVLKLRYEAYKMAGKVSDGKGPQDMVAAWDHKSRILTVSHNSKLVASIAVTFPDNDEMILDTERALPSGYPADFPSKTRMIEISRLCTHPSYRRGDLLHRLFEHTYKVFATSDREWIVTSCDDKLWPLYQKMGFKKTGIRYAHPSLAGIMHDLILGKLDTCLNASKINWIAWGVIYGRMTAHIDHRLRRSRGLLQRAKLTLASWLARFVKPG